MIEVVQRRVFRDVYEEDSIGVGKWMKRGVAEYLHRWEDNYNPIYVPTVYCSNVNSG